MKVFTAIFGPPLFILAITACVAVGVIGVGWYNAGSAIDLSAYILNAWQGDWIWPGVPIAHRVIDAAAVALGLDVSFPVFSWMTGLYGAVLAIFFNIFCVLVMLWIVVAAAHNGSKLLKWFWLRFKNAPTL